MFNIYEKTNGKKFVLARLKLSLFCTFTALKHRCQTPYFVKFELSDLEEFTLDNSANS